MNTQEIKVEIEKLRAAGAVVASEMTAEEIYEAYRDAGGEIHTLEQIQSAMGKKETWVANLASQLASGFAWVAGVYRQVRTEDVEVYLARASALTSEARECRATADRFAHFASLRDLSAELQKLEEQLVSESRKEELAAIHAAAGVVVMEEGTVAPEAPILFGTVAAAVTLAEPSAAIEPAPEAPVDPAPADPAPADPAPADPAT